MRRAPAGIVRDGTAGDRVLPAVLPQPDEARGTAARLPDLHVQHVAAGRLAVVGRLQHLHGVEGRHLRAPVRDLHALTPKLPRNSPPGASPHAD